MGGVLAAAGSLTLLGAAPSFAGQWAYSSSPQTVYNGGKAMGQSYGNVTASGNVSANGFVRDLVVGGDTIYVKLSNQYTYNGYPSWMDYTSVRHNAPNWTSISVSSSITNTMVSSSLSTCEDRRFAVDPCSSSYTAFRR